MLRQSYRTSNYEDGQQGLVEVGYTVRGKDRARLSVQMYLWDVIGI